MKTSNIPKIDLTSLVPQETFFATSLTISKDEPPIYLMPFTLRAQLWLAQKYKNEAEIKAMFQDRDVEKLAELGYFLTKDKERFPTFDSFLDMFGGPADSVILINSLLKCIGLSQPEIAHLTKGGGIKDPKQKAPSKTTKKQRRTGR